MEGSEDNTKETELAYDTDFESEEESDFEGEPANTMANIDEVPMGEWKKRMCDDTDPGLV